MTESLRDALERVMGLLESAPPGPWYVEPNVTDESWQVDASDGDTVCVVPGFDDTASDMACLIAGLADLLRTHGPALLAAVRDGERWQHFREHGEKVRAPYCLFEFGCTPEMLDAAVDDAILLASELESRKS